MRKNPADWKELLPDILQTLPLAVKLWLQSFYGNHNVLRVSADHLDAEQISSAILMTNTAQSSVATQEEVCRTLLSCDSGCKHDQLQMDVESHELTSQLRSLGLREPDHIVSNVEAHSAADCTNSLDTGAAELLMRNENKAFEQAEKKPDHLAISAITVTELITTNINVLNGSARRSLLQTHRN